MVFKLPETIQGEQLLIVKWTTLAGLAVLLALIVKQRQRRRNLPPGPQGLPLIGNKHQIPARKPWFKFKEWNAKYGSIISFHLGRTPVIVLGSAQAAWDLLDKRSDIYSSRPRFIMSGEILSENRRGLMLPYGDAWRQWRKILHTGFHARRAETYTPLQSLESKIALRDILHNPKQWERHLQRYAASVVVSVSYGRRVDSVDEWIVKENNAAMDYLTSVNIPGKYLVESWPWLLKLPRSLQWFRREPELYQQRDIKLYTSLLNDVKARMEDNACPDCLASQTLQNEGYGTDIDVHNKKGHRMSELDIAYGVSSPFGAGIETTVGTLSTFILAMLHFPHVQRNAQAELDSVIGPNRMPDFEDKDQLPYVRAVIDETLRWRPVAILGGTPHALTTDDEYQGMFIPKGSSIIANFAGIMHNPETFPSPDEFIPERFLEHSPLFNPQMKSFDLPFGFGRRICPGMHLARNSLFVNVARLLWAFNITPCLDENGEEVLPDTSNYTDGFNSRPVSFDCELEIRNPGAGEIVEKEGESAMGELEKWM